MSEMGVPSILFVERDPEFVADLLSLWRPTGAVRWVASAPEAIARITESVPSLVVLDLCLPADEDDGLRLLSTIRGLWGLDLPVVVVTRGDSADIRGRAHRLGATGFLSKPLDLEEFDRVVGDALRLLGSRRN